MGEPWCRRTYGREQLRQHRRCDNTISQLRTPQDQRRPRADSSTSRLPVPQQRCPHRHRCPSGLQTLAGRLAHTGILLPTHTRRMLEPCHRLRRTPQPHDGAEHALPPRHHSARDGGIYRPAPRHHHVVDHRSRRALRPPQRGGKRVGAAGRNGVPTHPRCRA